MSFGGTFLIVILFTISPVIIAAVAARLFFSESTRYPYRLSYACLLLAGSCLCVWTAIRLPKPAGETLTYFLVANVIICLVVPLLPPSWREKLLALLASPFFNRQVKTAMIALCLILLAVLGVAQQRPPVVASFVLIYMILAATFLNTLLRILVTSRNFRHVAIVGVVSIHLALQVAFLIIGFSRPAILLFILLYIPWVSISAYARLKIKRLQISTEDEFDTLDITRKLYSRVRRVGWLQEAILSCLRDGSPLSYPLFWTYKGATLIWPSIKAGDREKDYCKIATRFYYRSCRYDKTLAISDGFLGTKYSRTVLLMKALSLIRLGQVKSAKILLEQRRNEGNPYYSFVLGRIYGNEENYDLAIERLNEAMNLEEHCFLAYKYKAFFLACRAARNYREDGDYQALTMNLQRPFLLLKTAGEKAFSIGYCDSSLMATHAYLHYLLGNFSETLYYSFKAIRSRALFPYLLMSSIFSVGDFGFVRSTYLLDFIRSKSRQRTPYTLKQRANNHLAWMRNMRSENAGGIPKVFNEKILYYNFLTDGRNYPPEAATATQNEIDRVRDLRQTILSSDPRLINHIFVFR